MKQLTMKTIFVVVQGQHVRQVCIKATERESEELFRDCRSSGGLPLWGRAHTGNRQKLIVCELCFYTVKIQNNDPQVFDGPSYSSTGFSSIFQFRLLITFETTMHKRRQQGVVSSSVVEKDCLSTLAKRFAFSVIIYLTLELT